MYRKAPTDWRKHLDVMLFDILCLEAAFFLSFVIRHGFTKPFIESGYLSLGIIMAILDFLVAVLFSSFKNVLRRGYYQGFLQSLRHVVTVLAANVFFTFIIHQGSVYSRTTIVLTALFHLLFGYFSRILYRKWRKNSETNRRSLFVVTSSDKAEEVIKGIQKDISETILISGIAIIDRDMVGKKISGITVVANKDTVIDYVCRKWVDEIYIHADRTLDITNELYSAFMEMGLTVHMEIGKLSLYKDQSRQVEKIGDALVMTSSINMISGGKLFLKRLLDVVGGIVGSMFALLIMAVVAIPIKRQSPGPLLYTSERIGQNGKRFKMYKIRSMYLDADKRKEELMTQNRVKDGMMFKLDWDPRIIGNRTLPDGSHKTGIGEFIRKTSLDEFPQFFNVLKGDMSLVGTRPPTPDEWEKYEAHHRARMSTKPGITGMWQVSGRSEITDFEEVVRLDTEYISNWSIGLDVKILLQTVAVVVAGKGAM